MKRNLAAVGVAMVLCALAATPAQAFVKFGINDFGSKWDDPVHGTPATITWSFVTDGTTIDPDLNNNIKNEVVGGSNLTLLRNAIDAANGAGSFDTAIQSAFDTWAGAAPITFVQVADGGGMIGAPGSTVADIRIAAFDVVGGSGFEGVGAVGFGPPGDDLNFPDALAGDVLFNLDATFLIREGAEDDAFDFFDPFGNDLEGLFLHELGHAAIGLGHPTDGVGPVMTVEPFPDCCNFINRQLHPDDIAGAQSVYGPEPATALITLFGAVAMLGRRRR